jgi:hypothetical protein
LRRPALPQAVLENIRSPGSMLIGYLCRQKKGDLVHAPRRRGEG